MADNIQLNTGSGGAILAGASLSVSGDTAVVQFVGCGIVSGSEDSWTHVHLVGGAGAVAAGVQRVTLASDDPAVAKLNTIDADTGAIKTAVELIDDAIYTDDDDWTDNTSKHMLVGGLYQSTHQTITDGDVAPIQVTSRGHVVVTAIDSSMNDLEYAKENDNWNAADHGIILFARDTDSTPDKYRAVRSDASGNLLVVNSGTFAVQVITGQTGIAAGAGAVGVTVPRVTLASDDPGVALLGTIDADTGAIKTAVEKIDDAISGNEMLIAGGATQSADVKVTLDSEAVVLGTGSAAIGKLTANSGVDIGDTDVTSVVPGTGATNLGKAIGTAVGATDTGIAPLAVRDDTLSALSDPEGDFVPLRVGSTGALHVTGAGGGTQYNVQDVAGATDTGTALLVIRDDSLTTLTSDDGDYARLRVNSTGALHVTGGGGGTEYTEDIATADPIVGTATMMERDDVLSALTPAAGDWAALRCSAEGALWVQDFNSDGILADTAAMVIDLAAIEVLLGTIDADTGAIKTAVELIDNAVDGNYLDVNLNAAGTDLAMNAGAMSAQTTRVTIATDDTHFGAVGAASDIDGVVHGQLRYMADQLVTIDSDTNDIKTAVELLDNAVDGNFLNVNVNAAGTDLTMNAGVLTAQTQRVTIATDDEVNNLLGTIDADTGAIKLAVEIMDDWDDGSDHCEVVGADAENANVTGKPVLVAGRYDSSERTTATTDATTLATSAQGWMMVGNQSSYLFDGVTRCEVKRATGLAASGTTAMVAAVASKKIRGLALMLIPTSATVTNVYIANDDNDILGDSSNPIPLAMDADGDNIAGLVMPWNIGGWFETDTVNQALNLIISAAQDVIYALTYIEVA